MLSIYAIIDFTFSSRAINGVIWFLLFSVSILRLFLVCSLNLPNSDQKVPFLELFGNCKKIFEIFSQDVRFSRIEKLNCCHKILGLEPSKTSFWVRILDPQKKALKEWTWGSQDHLVCFNLKSIFASKSQIRQGIVLSEIPKGGVNVFLELGPMRANLSWCCCRAKISDYDDDCMYSNVQDGKDDDDCRLQWQVEKVNCHNWTPPNSRDCLPTELPERLRGFPPQALTRFSISRKSWEEMVHFFLSRAGELNFHFSRCSRMSRFWRKNSRSPLEIRDFEKNSLSLLERMRFCKQILFLFSILHSMSFPILVRNHILLFGLILTISVLQKGKVF